MDVEERIKQPEEKTKETKESEAEKEMDGRTHRSNGRSNEVIEMELWIINGMRDNILLVTEKLWAIWVPNVMISVKFRAEF